MRILIDSNNLEELVIQDHADGIEATVSDPCCWVCGNTNQITKHHTIPKHLHPKKNVIVPVCLPCHKNINEADLTGIKAFGYKIASKVKELSKEMGVWIHNANQIINKKTVPIVKQNP